jgi:glycosyltransferase involved in cell wall biosynthesis
MAKVAIIASYSPSLIGFRGDLIKALLLRGHTVVACGPDMTADLREEILGLGATAREIFMQRTAKNPISDLRTIWSLYRVLRQEQPDVVLAYTIKPILYGVLAARLNRLRQIHVLVTGLGYLANSPVRGTSLMSRLIRLAFSIVIRQCETVFFQNNSDRRFFIENGLLTDESKSRVVNGSGINLQVYAHAPMPSEPVFLMIARLLAAKGVREYAEAARILRPKFPHAKFRIAGWIDDGEDAIDSEEIDAWVEAGTIEYLGKLKDVRPALRSAKFFVLPSYYAEGVPRTTLEALATGRPVITTDMPGCRETVFEGVNGLLVPARDVDSLAEAMTCLIERPELAERMGERSRLLACDVFDVHKVNARMMDEMAL